MRRHEREIRDPAEIEDILKRARSCRLALAGEEGPYVVPLSYGYRDRTFYIHSAPAGRKIDMIRRDPRVCIQVGVDADVVEAEKACGWSSRYRSVIGFGRAVIVEDPHEKRAGLDILMSHYGEGPFDYDDASVGAMVILRVDIDTMTGKKSRL